MQNTELQTINAQTDLVLTVDSEPLIHFDLLNTEYIILVENNPSTKNGKQLKIQIERNQTKNCKKQFFIYIHPRNLLFDFNLDSGILGV